MTEVRVCRYVPWTALVLCLVLSADAHATTMDRVAVKCPVCDAKVAALSIMSTNNFGGVDRDFLERAVGSQPILI